jgi:hypothetical protein
LLIVFFVFFLLYTSTSVFARFTYRNIKLHHKRPPKKTMKRKERCKLYTSVHGSKWLVCPRKEVLMQCDSICTFLYSEIKWTFRCSVESYKSLVVSYIESQEVKEINRYIRMCVMWIKRIPSFLMNTNTKDETSDDHHSFIPIFLILFVFKEGWYWQVSSTLHNICKLL